MKLLNGNLSEDILRTLLKEGALPTDQLFGYVSTKNRCTKQGFYRALRKLRDDEQITWYLSTVSINKHWLRQIQKILSTAPNDSVIGNIGRLSEGEKLTLTIAGLSAMDRLWSHLFASIELATPLKYPLFLFNPHNWSALMRAEADRAHENVLRERQRPVYLVVGSASLLDKQGTLSAGFGHIEFSFNPKLRNECYAAAIGDYVIEVRFSPKTRQAMNEIFRTALDIKSGRRSLEYIDRSAACKIVIERNARKASAWAKRISQDFHIPERYRVK